MLFNPSSEGSTSVQDGRQSPSAVQTHPGIDAQWAPGATGCACGATLSIGARFCQVCGRQAAAAAIMPAYAEPASRGFPAWGIASIICSLIALVLVPFLFGALAILFGFFAWRENRGVGTALMIAGGVSIVVGIAIAIALIEAGAY